MRPLRSFASDNNAGVHPSVLEALAGVNAGHVVGYGDDPFTAAAVAKFRQQFGNDTEVFPVFNGTGANVLALSALTRSYEAVICAEAAHIQNDECGAPEKFTGCKLISLPVPGGKLTVEKIEEACHGIDDQHHVQPRVVSITQATEVGTLYSPAEIKALARFVHSHGMYLHMDGARIANAAASLGTSLRQITCDSGVDVLSFGGTKNGAMGAEAVVFFDKKLCSDFLFRRKQAMQLASKMRYISAQFTALFSGDLWLKNAQHANRMAKLLEKQVRKIAGLRIVYPVEVNGVFVEIERSAIPKLLKRYFFYIWDERRPVVRWMCSWDTTENDINEFAAFVAKTVRSGK